MKLIYAKWDWCDEDGDPGLMYVQAIDTKNYDEDIILRHAFVGENKNEWAMRNTESSSNQYTYMEHPFLSAWIKNTGFYKISDTEFNAVWIRALGPKIDNLSISSLL